MQYVLLLQQSCEWVCSMTEVPVIPDIEFKHVRSFLLFELFISPISRTRFITYLLHS